MFHATKHNNNSATYTAAGNVNGSVQTCENTQCCVGYLLVTSGKTEVNVLGKKLYHSVDMKSHNSGYSYTVLHVMNVFGSAGMVRTFILII